MYKIDGQNPTDYIEKIVKENYKNGFLSGFMIGMLITVFSAIIINSLNLK